MTTPKYLLLADDLRKEIFLGKFGPQGGLPSTKEIATKANVAVNTVKSALTRLEIEGVIVKRGAANAAVYYVNNIEIMMTQYCPPSHQLYHGFNHNIGTIEKVVLPEHLATKLQVAEQIVIRRVTIAGQIVEGQELPTQLACRYYLLTLADETIQRMRDDETFDPMYEPVNLVSHEEIMTRPATQEESRHLNFKNPTSVLSVLEVIRDTDKNILMAQELTLCPRIALIFDFPFVNRPK